MSDGVNVRREELKLASIYAIFGTIGLVTHFIPLCSASIVFYRALFGGIFIIITSLMSSKSIHIDVMRNNFIVLVATSLFMGLNWVLQFEAFKVSSVAIGTVCYNTMPIFLIIIAAIVFNEKISFSSVICILVALVGIFLVSNVINTGIKSNEVLGCVYGILGAIFYALIVIYNRKLSNIEMHDKIIFQFSLSAIIMFVYVIFISKGSLIFDNNISGYEKLIGIICILILSCFHTGFCYVQYFTSASLLKADTVAILTFIDPVVALFLSFFVLKERMTGLQFLGAILILLAAFVNELIKAKKNKVAN